MGTNDCRMDESGGGGLGGRGGRGGRHRGRGAGHGAAVPRTAKAAADDDDGECPVVCAITLAIPDDPVSTPCGHTFSKAALDEWRTKSSECPECRTQLPTQPLEVNVGLRAMINMWQSMREVLARQIACPPPGPAADVNQALVEDQPHPLPAAETDDGTLPVDPGTDDAVGPAEPTDNDLVNAGSAEASQSPTRSQRKRAKKKAKSALSKSHPAHEPTRLPEELPLESPAPLTALPPVPPTAAPPAPGQQPDAGHREHNDGPVESLQRLAEEAHAEPQPPDELVWDAGFDGRLWLRRALLDWGNTVMDDNGDACKPLGPACGMQPGLTITEREVTEVYELVRAEQQRWRSLIVTLFPRPRAKPPRVFESMRHPKLPSTICPATPARAVQAVVQTAASLPSSLPSSPTTSTPTTPTKLAHATPTLPITIMTHPAGEDLASGTSAGTSLEAKEAAEAVAGPEVDPKSDGAALSSPAVVATRPAAPASAYFGDHPGERSYESCVAGQQSLVCVRLMLTVLPAGGHATTEWTESAECGLPAHVQTRHVPGLDVSGLPPVSARLVLQRRLQLGEAELRGPPARLPVS